MHSVQLDTHIMHNAKGGKSDQCHFIVTYRFYTSIITMKERVDMLFGSTTDWYSQYVSIAETMRDTIYETGELIPYLLPLGGGTNIYDYSYYGILRPDIIISLFLPFLPMEYIIAGYMILLYGLSIVGMYQLLRVFGVEKRESIVGTILFLSANCFFHLHRQIVFINYMPFLILGMIAIAQMEEKRKRWLLPFSIFMILIHSYYYAIACIAVLYLFLYFYNPKAFWKTTPSFIKLVALGIGMAGFLLLPTASVILSQVGIKDGGSAADSVNLWQINFDFEGVLYDPYGVGLTILTLTLFFLSLGVRRYRVTSGIVCMAFVLEAIPYILNGFLYARPKILMPFLPVVILISILTLQEIKKKKIRRVIWVIPILMGIVWAQQESEYISWMILDLVIVVVLVITFQIYLCNKERIHWKRITQCIGIYTIAIVGGSVFIHQEDTFITEKQTRVSHFTEEEREEFYQDKNYRFDSFSNQYQTANQLLTPGATRSSMYTSTGNALYSNYYNEIMDNPIRINNRVALLSVSQPFFLQQQGVRYLETTQDYIPYGYEVVLEREDAVLAENQNAVPRAYGTSNLISEEQLHQLDTQVQMEILNTTTVVQSEEVKKVEVDSEFIKQEEYEVREIEQGQYELYLPDSRADSIYYIAFEVGSLDGKEVVIDIQNTRNKLASENAPYPNENYEFTYVISGIKEMEGIPIQTKGTFEIEDLEIWVMQGSEFASMEYSEFIYAEDENMGDEVLMKGTIEMEEAGYFVTTIPMQKGMKAHVNQQEVKVEAVNTAFVGIPLEEGESEISLTFSPPYIRIGIGMTILSITLWGWMIWRGVRINEDKRE